MIPKTKAWRSKRYLDWVKTLPCVLCGCPADDAHHAIGLGLSGMGMTAADYYAIPVCRGHHSEIHVKPEVWSEQWEWVTQTMGKALDEGVLCIK